MEWLKKIGAAIDYIEGNLDGEISYDEAARIAGAILRWLFFCPEGGDTDAEDAQASLWIPRLSHLLRDYRQFHDVQQGKIPAADGEGLQGSPDH